MKSIFNICFYDFQIIGTFTPRSHLIYQVKVFSYRFRTAEIPLPWHQGTRPSGLGVSSPVMADRSLSGDPSLANRRAGKCGALGPQPFRELALGLRENEPLVPLPARPAHRPPLSTAQKARGPVCGHPEARGQRQPSWEDMVSPHLRGEGTLAFFLLL